MLNRQLSSERRRLFGALETRDFPPNPIVQLSATKYAAYDVPLQNATSETEKMWIVRSSVAALLATFAWLLLFTGMQLLALARHAGGDVDN